MPYCAVDTTFYNSTVFCIFRQTATRYNACTMQVYAEYALLENFCMDFTLLYAAKAAVKNPAKYPRICVASALGACFAVVYPLIGIGGAIGIVIKLVAGALMCAVAGKFQTFKGYVKFSAVFAAASFLVGGALLALFSLAGAEYRQGGGFIISSVPVGIPMFAAVTAAIIIKRVRNKFSAGKSAVTAYCKIYSGNSSATCAAFFDSGNKVYFNGSPVTIVPAYVAKQLTDEKSIKNYVDIHTVAGAGKIAVFTAEKLEIDDGKNKYERRNVTIGISPRHINKIVLHPDLSEVN